MTEGLGTKCAYLSAFTILPGNSSIAIRLCSRNGIIPTLEEPSVQNCNENLDSLASQVILTCCLQNGWDSAASQ